MGQKWRFVLITSKNDYLYYYYNNSVDIHKKGRWNDITVNFNVQRLKKITLLEYRKEMTFDAVKHYIVLADEA